MGLPARNASACAEKMAAQVAVSAASISGASGSVGATWTRACSPTRPAASIMARTVSRVGSPNHVLWGHVVSGKTMNPTTATIATALTRAASKSPRRSSATAIAAESSPATAMR